MAKVRGEFILMGGGGSIYAANVIREVVGTFLLTVDGTATPSGDRPVCPNVSRDGETYVRLTAIDGQLYVAWGANPTASGDLAVNEMRLVQDMPDAIAISGGHRLSFITGD